MILVASGRGSLQVAVRDSIAAERGGGPGDQRRPVQLAVKPVDDSDCKERVEPADEHGAAKGCRKDDQRWSDPAQVLDHLVDAVRLAGVVHLELDRKSTRLNSSHIQKSRMPSSA